VAGRHLPGSDKYRVPEVRDAPWHDPLVVRANTDVSFVGMLNDYFALHVPIDADGWKTRCPFAAEHEDGGLDKQFRVYAPTNSGHCFALHGTMDPVRLWRLRSYFPSLRDAAQSLLEAFGVEYRTRPYWERMADLREEQAYHADPATLTQTINVFLSAQPDYEVRQYRPDVLHHVNWTLGQIAHLCETATTIGEVEAWLHQSKRSLRETLSEPGSAAPAAT
jgi:hypothetical protein